MRFYDYTTHYEEYLSTPFPWAVSGMDPSTYEQGIKYEIERQLDTRLIRAGHKSATGKAKLAAYLTPLRLPFSFPINLYSLRPYMEQDYPESMYTFYTALLALLTNFSGQINQRALLEPKDRAYGDITNILKHLLLEPIELFGPEHELEGLSNTDLATRTDLSNNFKLIQVGAFKRWLWGYIFKVQSERVHLHESRPTFNVYPGMIRAILRGSSDKFFEKLTTNAVKDLFKKEKSCLLQLPKYTLSPTAVSYDISNKELWPKDREDERALADPSDWLSVYMGNISEEVEHEQEEFEYSRGRVVSFQQGDGGIVLGNILITCATAVPPHDIRTSEAHGIGGASGEVVSSQIAKYFDKDKPRWDDEMVYSDSRGVQTERLKEDLIASFDKLASHPELRERYPEITEDFLLAKPFFVYPRETFEFTDIPAAHQDVLVVIATFYDTGSFEASSISKDRNLRNKISFVESRIAKEIVIVLPLLENQPISEYLNTLLDNQASSKYGRNLLKTVLHLALGNLFLAANRDEKTLPIRPDEKPADDYQGHVNRAVAQKDLSKVTEKTLIKLANDASQEIYKNRLFREPQSWTGRDAGITLLEIIDETIHTDPKFVCDLCHEKLDPEKYTMLTSAAMEKAVLSGFNPFMLGIAKGSEEAKKEALRAYRNRSTSEKDVTKEQFIENYQVAAKDSWLARNVMLDVSGWSLCDKCYPQVTPHLSTKDLRYPSEPPTAAIQRLIGPVSKNVEIFTEDPTPPWRTLFPKQHLRPMQRMPEGVKQCNQGKRCHLDEKKWRRCCGYLFKIAKFSVRGSEDTRDAGYLHIVAKGGSKKTSLSLSLAPIPKLYNIGERLEYRLRSMQNKILQLKNKALKQGVSFDTILEEEYYKTDDPDTLSFLEEAASPVAGNMQIHWISQRRKWLEEHGEKIPGSRKALQQKLIKLSREGTGVPSDWAGSGVGCGYGWGGFSCPEWQLQVGEVCDHLPELRFVSPHTVKTAKKRVPKRLQRARKKAEKRKRIKRAAKEVLGTKSKRKEIVRPPSPRPPEEIIEGEFPPETVATWALIGQMLGELPGWEAKHIEDVLSGKLTPEQLVEVRKGLYRDTKMVEKVKKGYRDTCQVCGLRLTDGKGKGYSEGAHIIPFAAVSAANRRDLDVKSNILILCPNHHTEFDLGALAIIPVETEYTETIETDKTTVRVPRRQIDYMIEHLDPNNLYHGAQLTVIEGHDINPYFVAHRRERFEDLVRLLEGRLSRYGVAVSKPWNVKKNPDVPSRWSDAFEGSPIFEGVHKNCRLCGHSFPVPVDEADDDLVCVCECCKAQDNHYFTSGGFCEECYAAC